jgi:hypothetical protein
MTQMRLRIDGRTFRDPQNREVTLHGINCAADAKLPATPDLPSHISEKFFDGDNVSFVNRPFSLEDASTHFSRLRSWGYNTLRYIFTWEAIEHAGPGKYDEQWIDHTISVLRKAKEYGFYIFMDPHQDVVSTPSWNLNLLLTTAVVKILWRLGGAYVDTIRMRSRSATFRCHRSIPRSEHVPRAGQVSQDDLGDQLHTACLSGPLHVVLWWKRLCTQSYNRW